MIAVDEILKGLIRQWVLLQGEMDVGAEIVDPNLLRLPLRGGGPLVEEDDVGLDAGLIEDAGGQSQDGVQIGGVQQLLAHGFAGAAL